MVDDFMENGGYRFKCMAIPLPVQGPRAAGEAALGGNGQGGGEGAGAD